MPQQNHNATGSAIMVAPNGARLTTQDYPALPVTVPQTIETALACKEVGAQALHAHVRDAKQQHLLDAESYRELLKAGERALGSRFPIQITTEAFGIYQPEQQIQLVKTLQPRYASVAMREMIRSPEHESQAADFYQWASVNQIAIQHILYDREDFTLFNQYRTRGIIPADEKAVLMVMGRYTESKVASPEETEQCVFLLAQSDCYWMLCAFGETETPCLVQAAKAGGGTRIGFENNVFNMDGAVATGNAQRVAELAQALQSEAIKPCDELHLLRLLGAKV